jgi:hypothetical protein
METFSHQTARLSAGRHCSPDDGVCVMELASVLAGERFSDRPRAVSASIAAFLRGYNDGLDDARRQALKRFASTAIGTVTTRGDEKLRLRRISASIGEPAGPGFPAWVSRGWARRDPYHAGRTLGRRVDADDDDRLHARALRLVDELIGIGRRGGSAPEPDAARPAVIAARVPRGPRGRDC